MAKWEGGEAAFEAQNGFRRKVNSMTLGSHARALSGSFGVPAYASAGSDADYACLLATCMPQASSQFFACDW